MNACDLKDADIFLSGDMNCEKIIEIVKIIQADPELQGEKLPRFAVGRQLAKVYALGMTAKISCFVGADGIWHDTLKPALDHAGKRTYPGMVDAYALHNHQGQIIGNIVTNQEYFATLKGSFDVHGTMVDLAQAREAGLIVPLTKMLFENGGRTADGKEPIVAQNARAAAQRKLIPHNIEKLATIIDLRVQQLMSDLTFDIAAEAAIPPLPGKYLSATEIRAIQGAVAEHAPIMAPGSKITGELEARGGQERHQAAI